MFKHLSSISFSFLLVKTRFLLEKQIAHLQKKLAQSLIEGSNDLLKKLEQEMQFYFREGLNKFTIPLYCIGSDFQKNVWRH